MKGKGVIALALVVALHPSLLVMAATPGGETPPPTLYFDIVALTKEHLDHRSPGRKFTDLLLPELEDARGMLGKEETRITPLIDETILPALRMLDQALARPERERKKRLREVTDHLDRATVELMQAVRFFDRLSTLVSYGGIRPLPKPTFKDFVQRLLRMSSYAIKQESCRKAVLDRSYAHFQGNTRKGMIAVYLRILTQFLSENAAAIDGRLSLPAKEHLIDAIEEALEREERWIDTSVSRTRKELKERCHVSSGPHPVERAARLISPTKNRLLQILEVVSLLPTSD